MIYFQKSFLINKLVTYTINHSDFITCDVMVVKERIIKQYCYNPDKIVMFPWGIDLQIFNPENNQVPVELFDWKDKIIVVCTRQHMNTYGITYLIDAIPIVLKKNNRVRFLFIGNGPLTKMYKDQIFRLNIGKYVKFIGKVNNELLPLYLNNSDIYVSPSLSDGSSLCLMEALGCAVPSVVSDIDANLEWIEDNFNGIVFKRQNSKHRRFANFQRYS